MKENKFRAWDKEKNQWFVPTYEAYKGNVEELHITLSGRLGLRKMYSTQDESNFPDRFELTQYIGLSDSEDKEFCIGDIAEFDNGDKFVLKMEDWLEVYVDWIGDPECEDQARDLCRISKAKIIGNIYQNPELLKAVVPVDNNLNEEHF